MGIKSEGFVEELQRECTGSSWDVKSSKVTRFSFGGKQKQSFEGF